ASIYSWTSVYGAIQDPGVFSAISQSGVVPSYTIKSSDIGKYIQLAVSARDDKGNVGNTIVVTTGMFDGGILRCPPNSTDCISISQPSSPVGMVTGSTIGSFFTLNGTARASFAGTVYLNVPIELVANGFSTSGGYTIKTTTPDLKFFIKGNGKLYAWFDAIPSGRYTASVTATDGKGKSFVWNFPVSGYTYFKPISKEGPIFARDIYNDRSACTASGDSDVALDIAGSVPSSFWEYVNLQYWSSTHFSGAQYVSYGRVKSSSLTSDYWNDYELIPSTAASDMPVSGSVYRDTGVLKDRVSFDNTTKEIVPGNGRSVVGWMCWRRF
ncbi:hypothetical protein RY966_004648, partial [Enterobacter kobei]|nr:hypothetical protein [Enterobacter kobei]